ncbi:cation transporter [Candidatus Saccharibacteria bacterium]|nr:cation transporter [Candidatus Saccharibacteria bacterium]
MNDIRHRKIITTSIIGILANLLLVIFKAIVGIMSNSIAIILDAVNNFSDMLSSIVTIVGSYFANLMPDRKHPMGHGRSEYLSAAVVAVIIMYIGFTAFVESVKKIITPETPDYSTLTLIIVIVAIIVKIVLGLYVHKVGKKVDSDSLIGSGKDALFDALISLATLVAAIIFMTTGFSVEAYLAAAISLFITYSGFKMLRETFSVILGERADSGLSRKIREEVCHVDGVEGAYDLVLHDYGPNMTLASINIEIADSMTAIQIDDISREIRHRVYHKCHVLISAVGVYSINIKDAKAAKLRKQVYEIVTNFEHVIQMHGFHVDEKAKEISLDVVVSFDVKSRRSYHHRIRDALKEAIPEYDFEIALDSDFSD